MKLQPVRLIFGSLLAAFVVFEWGFVFWTLIPMPEWGLRPVPGDKYQKVNEAVVTLDQGTYVSPMHPGQIDGETMEQFNKRHEAEPFVFLSVNPKGSPAMSPSTLLQGYINALIAALCVGLLLNMAGPALCCYSHRVFFVTMAGIFAAMWTRPGQSIWFMRSCGLTTWYVIYDVVAWLLAGLVLAAIITGQKSKAETAEIQSSAADAKP